MVGNVDQGRAVGQGRVVLLLHQARHGESHFLYVEHVDICEYDYAIKEYWADRKPG